MKASKNIGVYSGILVPPQNEQLIPENRPGSESKQDCLRILYWYIRLFAVILVPWIVLQLWGMIRIPLIQNGYLDITPEQWKKPVV